MVGRLLFGIISDRLGCKAVFFMTYMATLFVILWVILSPDGQMPITSFYSVAFISAACFGGNIIVFPTWVADYFGLKNHTWNYSLIYQGFGIASLVAGIIFFRWKSTQSAKIRKHFRNPLDNDGHVSHFNFYFCHYSKTTKNKKIIKLLPAR